MRKLGEQWVEELDGKKHMFKAVTPIINGHPDIKDLGILNEEGLLPCPFCGEYPEKLVGNDTWCWYACNCGCELGVSATRKEAVDAWNRRA